ncbi:GNAT family N-acetyltransferase [Fulvimarina sp. MAC3]|uniref:GNAT family N-acetyltransferase n=1 Tax=Fulvimarina sp. MAC3 TaxID=3148887 RepID=UPI0031FC4CB5
MSEPSAVRNAISSPSEACGGCPSIIETDRLILRAHTLADLPHVHRLGTDPEIFRFTGNDKPSTEEESWRRLLFYIGHWSALGFGMFAMTDRKTGTFLGETGIKRFNRGIGPHFDPYPEAAWRLLPFAQGKGYAAEAVTAVHDWFSARCTEPKTVCMINFENAPSLKLAEKLGYRPFGEADYKDERLMLLERPLPSHPAN